MPRKIRADSVTGQIAAFANAGKIAEPPQRLGKKEMIYWVAIYTRRAAGEWQPLDLLKACELCRLYVDRDIDRNRMRREGGSVNKTSIQVKKGAVEQTIATSKRNPRDVVLVQRERLIMATEKHLRLHTNADRPHPTQIRSQRIAEAAAREALLEGKPGVESDFDDGLLPMFTALNKGTPTQ